MIIAVWRQSRYKTKPMNHWLRWSVLILFIYAVLTMALCAPLALCQLVNTGGGPGTLEPAVAAIDFSQLVLEENTKKFKQTEQERLRRQGLIDSGMVSALDLAAPVKAIHEFNEGVSQMRAQHPQDAIAHWQKAIILYPKFISAYNGLGLAYLDLEDSAQAKSQFETAVKLDERYAGSWLNLGRLEISQNDFAAAQSYLDKAASIRPNKAGILTSLAYAQHGEHQDRQAIATVARVHELPHPGMGNAHYVAAAAALALNDADTVARELNLFLKEDPTNALAPAARRNLNALAHNRTLQATRAAGAQPAAVVTQGSQTFSDSVRLKAELKALGNEPGEGCENSELVAEANPAAGPADAVGSPDVPQGSMGNAVAAWTIRKVVDEVALFFVVSSHGHTVNDLQLPDIQIRDNAKPPEKIIEFSPQSKLPLRVALLIDTSGSVQPRFSFEKYAAGRFLQQLLTNSSDLAFVAGFANTTTVTQDFTSDREALTNGINQLTNGGGTALFDAVSFACSKLAAYPERERVAKVLVILSDGEDNSSHTTLRHAVRDAEVTGVTIYSISTKEDNGTKTAADHVLEALAERSGGEALFPGDSITLRKSFDKLHDLIRSRYLVAYRPADFEANGSYRAIEIIAEKNGKRLTVHARKGYRAPVSPLPVE